MVRLWEMLKLEDGKRKVNSQGGLDVYIPEAGEKPGKMGVMETKGDFQKGENDGEYQCYTEIRLGED